jgi:hypothetical protein
MHLLWRLLLVFLTLQTVLQTEVSYDSIKGFWEAIYDTDRDGKASLADFQSYF